MKKILALLCVSLIITSLRAQDCSGFYFLSNSEVEMTVFDKKGNDNGKVTYKISNIQKSDGNTTADFTSEMVNEKGKSITKGSGKYKCVAGVFYIDAKFAMPQEQMAAYKDMDIKAEEVFIEYPASMSVGQTLKDANFAMEIYSKGNLFSTTTYDQTNRKVVGKESVTTGAGAYECYKITFDGRFKASIAPLNIGVPVSMQGTEWFSPGFGIVKTETNNKNGKLMGSTQITAVKK